MCNIDYDMPDLYSQSYRIAKKRHVCYECARFIEPKEKYSYVFAIYGKENSSYKTCYHCFMGQEWLLKTCGGFLHGNLEEEIKEHAEDYKRMDLYRFVVGINKKWNKLNIPKLKD